MPSKDSRSVSTAVWLPNVGEFVDDVAGVGYRAGEPVELGDDEAVAFAAGGEGFAQSRAVAVGASEAVVDIDPFLVHTERGKASTLGRQVLIGGRDARVSDQQLSHGISVFVTTPLTGHFLARVLRESG